MASRIAAKMYRDFFQTSPCREAFLAQHEQVLPQQYARNCLLRVKPTIVQLSAPTTVPTITASAKGNPPKRPGAGSTKRKPSNRPQQPSKRKPTAEQHPKPSDGAKKSKPTVPAKEPKKPGCKICDMHSSDPNPALFLSNTRSMYAVAECCQKPSKTAAKEMQRFCTLLEEYSRRVDTQQSMDFK